MTTNLKCIILIMLSYMIILFTIWMYTFKASTPTVNNTVGDFENMVLQSIKSRFNSNNKILLSRESKDIILPEKNMKSIIVCIMGTDERFEENSRSDVLIVVKYTPKTNSVLIISIPRDSRVNIPNKGMRKINSAHAFGGEELQVKVLEELLDVKIPYYFHMNFIGFVEVVDILGGVRINSKKEFRVQKDLSLYSFNDSQEHDDSREIIIPKGEQVLSGQDALAYVRFRKDSDGDFGRIERQQEVLISIAQSILYPRNLIKIPRIFDSIDAHIESNMNWDNVFRDILHEIKLKPVKFESYTLKTKSKIINGIWYEIIDKKDLERLSELLNTE